MARVKNETCCARCGFHYVQASGQTTRAMEATDYVSGKWTDAKKVVYVSGSDVTPCASKEIQRDAQECCYVKGFDRCLPSLIAFGDRDAAATFQKQHGGELAAFDKIAAT